LLLGVRLPQPPVHSSEVSLTHRRMGFAPYALFPSQTRSGLRPALIACPFFTGLNWSDPSSDRYNLPKAMIDPFISLALSVQSNRGVYALLLGSGISRSAQIPTGWEVVEDLIRKIARLREQDCGADPAAWYTETFNAAPSYSDLLAEIAKTPAEVSVPYSSGRTPANLQRCAHRRGTAAVVGVTPAT